MRRTSLALLLGLLLAPASATPAAERAFEVRVVGSGRPAILIPGLTCSGDVWLPTAEHFAAVYESHILTLAGFAGVPPVEGPFLSTVRDDLARYIRDAGLEQPIVIGHSIGGFLALWLAASEPDLVGPVVSVDGVPFLPALRDPRATERSTRRSARKARSSARDLTPIRFRIQNRMMLLTMISDPAHATAVAEKSTLSDPPTVAEAVYELMTTDRKLSCSGLGWISLGPPWPIG